ncbi:tripartite tricarboxylate transporter TctB family protein [Pasteurellaceae bacterium TAE3-ERU1]|uniref:tripartite tricarboxylate transporter TctB family protein n=1 Tax=Spirabiliibacterium mucosae TaxID=28156 RepID=UPI001AAC55A3|nr:tripartite tricarboxylate transporter TctB family protein [Spirabiliibacterium mucosae]MBE2898639.1 tripartite tricarboxylate transporter TctB family protein [Spirabiliibacterium mucosae]MBV7387311.1 tripartite tricarboxylate transporter TctB family protein [Pasteurellaceae bacterium TAE3-ERU1]
MGQTTFADRLFGLCMVLLALTYGYLGLEFEQPFGAHETIGPRTFPTIIAVLLGLSGLWLVIKPQESSGWARGKTWLLLLVVVLVLVVYALLLEPLGFIPTSLLCCGFLSYLMGAKPVSAFAIAAVYSTALYLLFNFVLELMLPAGILGGVL